MSMIIFPQLVNDAYVALEVTVEGEWRITGTAISDLITWQDKRCSDEFISNLPASSTPLHTGYGCATLFWLQRHTPNALSQYDCAGTIMDLIVALLCGLQSPVMSCQNAASWGYYLMEECEWQYELLAENGFPIRLLPHILPAGSVVGATKTELCDLIPSGTEVYVAAGDAQCSIMSTKIEPHQAVLNLGTSCQISALISSPAVKVESPHVQVWPLYDGLELQVAASVNGGNVLEVLVSMIAGWLRELGIELSSNVIWSKLTGINSPDLHKYDQMLTVDATLYKERAASLQFSGASVSGLTSHSLSLDAVYVCTCIGLIRNIESMFPVRSLKESGVSEIICAGSVFETHPVFYEVVKYIYQDMRCHVLSDVNAAYGAVLLARMCNLEGKKLLK